MSSNDFFSLVEEYKKKKKKGITTTTSVRDEEENGEFWDLVDQYRGKDNIAPVSSQSIIKNAVREEIAPVSMAQKILGSGMDDETMLSSFSLAEFRAAKDEVSDRGDQVRLQSLFNQKLISNNAEILSKTKMDGKEHSVLEEMNLLAKMDSGDEKDERKSAVLKKMEELGLSTDDYAMYAGDSNFSWENFGNWAGNAAMSGLASFNKGITSTVDLILGNPLKALGWENNPVSEIADYYSDIYDSYKFKTDLYAQKLGGGKGHDFASSAIEGTMGAVPNAILALMTAGTSMAGTAATTTSSLTTQAAYQSGNILTKAGLTTEAMMKNPQYWLSFARTYGTDYEEAKSMGASDTAAVLGATLTSLVNAGIEIGTDGLSGIQGLPQEIAEEGGSKLLKWAISNVEEGGEEGLQKFVNEVVAKTMYNHDLDILNPKEYLEEMAIGTISGAALGGGQIALQGASNAVGSAVQNYQDHQLTENEQKVVDKVVEDRIAEKEKDGTKLTKKEKSEIHEEVFQQMKKGYISIETIEEVLGDRSAYDALEKESKEFDTLYNTATGQLSKAQQNRLAELEAKNNENPYKDALAKSKEQYSKGVFDMVNGDRLSESYREKDRVYQDFQADFDKYKGTKYEEAARKTLESAMKAGANNTNRVHDLVDMAAQISADTGRTFEFKSGEQIKNDFVERQTKVIAEMEKIPEAKRTAEQSKKLADLKDLLAKVQSGETVVNGDITADGIVLNLDSGKPLNRTVGHEVTHSLENAKSYKELKDSLYAYAKSKGIDIDNELNTRKLMYEGVADADPEAELVADLVGDFLFTDSEYVRKLSTENQNVFQKFWDKIKYLCKVATAGSQEARELARVEKAFADAYREGGAVKGTKHSISAKTDTAYMDAVNRGDTETAQKMVDEAAKNAGFPVRLLHGTQKFGFTVTDTSLSDDKLSFFATSDVDTAKTYSSLGGKRGISEDADYDSIDEESASHEENARDMADSLADKISRWAGYYGYVDGDYIHDRFRDIVDDYERGRFSADEADSHMYEFADDVIANGYSKDAYDGQEFYEWQESEEAEALYTEVNKTISAYFALADFNLNADRSGNYDLYANTDGLLVIEGNGAKWNDIKSDVLPDITSDEYKKYGYRGHWDKWTTRSVSKYASDNGYRGVLFKNIYDDGGKSSSAVRKPADVYSFFYPQEQVKSADPVTYDDSGNVIPLSERFNEKNDDIRFSLSKPVEETKDLIAVHNLHAAELLETLNLSGLPSPSVAIIKAKDGHEKYGDVSLILPKDAIDPQTNKANRIYGSDAWTPTRGNAPVEYEVNYDTQRQFERTVEQLAQNVANGIFSRSSILGITGIEDSTSMNLKEIADKISDYDAVRAAYVAENGGDVDVVYRTKVFDSYGNDALGSYVGKVGEQEVARLAAKILTGERLTAEEIEAAKDSMMESWVAKHEYTLKRKPELREGRIAKYRENISDIRVEDFVKHAWEFYEDSGATSDEIDRLATGDNLRAAANRSDVAAWVTEKLQGLLSEPAIYNGKDPFAPGGKRRSFEEMHWEYTAENIVRAMNNADARGANVWNVSGEAVIATATPEYKNIDEVRADKDRLFNAEKGDYDQIKDEISNELQQVTTDILRTTEHQYDNQYDEEQSIGRVIMEAAQGNKTLSGIKQVFKNNGYRIGDAQAKAVLALFDHASKVPTGYFEAKPQRVVGFDEVGVYVIPRNADVKLKQELLNRGYSIAEYDPDVEGDRQKVVNQFEEYKFSLSNVGDQFAPTSSFDISGKDFRVKDPTQETVSEMESVPAVEKATSHVLYNGRDGENGWGKVYTTAQEALNDAVQSLNPGLWDAISEEIGNSVDVKNANTPMTDALIAVQEDVRQSTITPMQGAQLLSDAYGYGGAAALRGLYNPKTGNLYNRYLEKAKQYETVTPETEETDLFPDDLAPMEDSADRLASLDDADAPVDVVEDETTTEDIDPAQEIKTVKERLSAKLTNSQTELANVKQLREESSKSFDEKIAKAQALLDSKKNQDTKVANNIKRRIERLQRLKADVDAEYAKRINDIESKVTKTNTELEKDHTKQDNLERAYARIDAQLEREKAVLAEEFNQRRESLKDKNTYISQKASELYNEIRNLKKGVRASDQLGYLLDTGHDWSSIRSALVNIKHTPGERVNLNSAIESIAREMLNEDYENSLYNLDDEYQAQVKQLEEDAEKSRDEARKAQQRVTRKNLHAGIVDKIKARFAENGFDFDSVLKKAKNLSTFATVDNTPQRVMEKSLGYKEGGVLADLTVNKVAQNETEGIKWLNSFTDRKSGLLANISKQYGIKPGSKASAAAQMYAEGFYVNDNNEIIQYGDAELAQDFKDAKVRENIKKLARDPRIRQIYDETLAMINESRVRNGYPEIPRLDNYFLHFRAMDDTFSRLGLPFNPNDIKAKDLPTDLNGVTADLKPGQPYFASAMHRTGKRTSFDLLGGLEKYLTSAKNQIYHIDDIQTLRALRNYIADAYGQANGLEGLDALTEEEAQDRIEKVYNSHLSTFAKFLNEEANILAGKTALIDRGLEGIIGRRGITFLNTVNGQVGSNMVGFNLSSSLTNFLPVAQTFAKTNKADFVKAFGQTVANKVGSVFGRSDGFTENSPVVIRRKGADRFHRTPYQKVGDFGYVFMSAVDDISTELIARTKYNELTRKGMDSQQAHYETDKWVSRLMGDRSLGQMPQIYNSKMLGLITKFQLEVRNQLDSQFYDTIQEAKVSNEDIQNRLERNAKTAAKVTSTFVQLAVAQHLFGMAFESVAGYNPAFDIIEVMIKALGWDDEEDSEDTALDNIEQGFFALLDDLPYTSTFTGGRIPIESALPIEQFVKGVDQYGNEKSRLETLGEVAPYYLLPGGYGQIKKTAQGLGMFSDEHPIAGSYTDSGALRFPVEDTWQNRLQAGVFGQYASQNAGYYFDNDIAPLKDKQIQEFIDVDMPIRDYWDYRKGLSGLDTLSEKADYIDSLDLTDEQKNILINNIADRKEDIDMSDYGKYGSFEEFDFAEKYPEKYSFFQENGITYQDYASADEEGKRAYTWASENPGKYEMSKAISDDFLTYWQYKTELGALEGDKDANGKTISGSKKNKVIAYINDMDLDYGQKIILFKSEYNSDDTYNYDIIEYLNGRDDISYRQMETILKVLGFNVDAQGNITWD